MRRPLLHMGLTTLLFISGAWAQPQIDTQNRTELARSGRLALEGTGFGSQGTVSIAGINAWVSTWTDTRVVAYIPEAAPLGQAPVLLTSGGQQSNEVSVDVTIRQADGRVRWVFEADTDQIWWRPAVAPDGTLYVHAANETEGVVYAVSPDGALRWIQKVNWYPYVPPTAGPDGAAYVGSINSAYRIAPNGGIDWVAHGTNIFNSPTAGPDGRVYGVFRDLEGAFAIDPATGHFDWTNEGNPPVNGYGMTGCGVVFGRAGTGEPIDRFYVNLDALWAFSLDGDQLFVSGVPNNNSHEPAVGADGVIYAPGYLEDYMVAYDPSDGHILWDARSPWRGGLSDFEIGADDTLYFAADGTYLYAYDPHSRSARWSKDTGVWVNRPTLSPDGDTLVAAGGGTQGLIPFVKGLDAATGDPIFHIDLQPEWLDNFRHVPTHHAAFSPDSLTAYVSSWTAQWPVHDGDPRASIFAIDTTPGLDCDSDGVPDGQDNCECVYNPDQTDRDGDGIGDACDDFVQADDCADATPLCPGVYSGNTYDATPDGASTCGQFPQDEKDVWYTYTPATSGEVTISGCDAIYPLYLSAHTGCPGTTQNEVACDTDSCGPYSPSLSFFAQAGQTYYIRLHGHGIFEIEYTITVTGPDCGTPCPADFNGDGAVNTLDVLAFLNAWSSGDPRGDFNGDGAINTLDVLAFLNAWNAGC